MHAKLTALLKWLRVYEKGKEFRDSCSLALRILDRRFRAHVIRRRIRKRPPGQKIKVLFLVSEIAKWKCQGVYEALEQTGEFDPIIALTALGEQARYTDEELEVLLAENERYFTRLGDKHLRAVRLHPRQYLDLETLHPDIVFFQDPYRMREPQTTECVSRHALVCYVPYYVPDEKVTSENMLIMCLLPMYRFLHIYFVYHDKFAAPCKRASPFWTHMARYVTVGHPSLDRLVKMSAAGGEYVIYAPHWTVKDMGKEQTPSLRGTFSWNGQYILEYAQRHPEYEWVFKPHPKLRKELVETGMMTCDEADEYYQKWSGIGEVCQDGSYQDLFLKSRALITDSASFLVEYGVTGRPIIHLKNDNFNYENLYEGFYEVLYPARNLSDLRRLFSMVIERREDPLKDERLRVLKRAGLCVKDASERIAQVLGTICNGR